MPFPSIRRSDRPWILSRAEGRHHRGASGTGSSKGSNVVQADPADCDAGQGGKALESLESIDERGGMVGFHGRRPDHADAEVVHGSGREPPGGVEMVNGVCRPSDGGVFSDESSDNLDGQVALPHVDAMNGGAEQSCPEINIDTVIHDHRCSIAHGVGDLGHQGETLRGW